jgi:chromosome segregation ATPase
MGDRVMHMAEAERRINQVKNDVDEIWGKLDVIGKVQAEHTKQLRALNATVAKVWTTQQLHGDRLNKLDAAVASLDEKLSEMRATNEQRFTKIDQRFAQIEARFAQIDDRFAGIDRRFDAQDEKFAGQDKKLDLIMKALNIGAN